MEKHSCAQKCAVEVRVVGQVAVLSVLDDGIGGAAVAKGHGLAGLVDRGDARMLELGGDPRQLIQVRTRNAVDALAAANDILACPHAGAVLLEMEGMPKCLDLVASRRLALAAGESGVTVFCLRNSARAEPSAALTRWQVTSAPSHPNEDDWGNPVFDVHLTRHRAGGLGSFLMKWNVQNACFETADIGAVVRTPADRPAFEKVAI